MSESVFNEGSIDVDFRVEGNGVTHAFFVEGESDNIAIGTNDPGDYRLKAIATQTNQDCIYGTANGSGRGVLGYSPSGKGGYFWSDSGTGCWVGDGGLELQDSDMRIYANSADDGSRAIYFYKSQSATDKAHGGNASMDKGDDIGLIGFLGSEQSGWRWAA